MTHPDSKICFPKDVLFHELGGEAVILNVETGKYYGLDEVGTRMWMLLTEHGSPALALAALLEEYDVDPQRLQSDLLGLVDQLAAHGLLSVDGEG